MLVTPLTSVLFYSVLFSRGVVKYEEEDQENVSWKMNLAIAVKLAWDS